MPERVAIVTGGLRGLGRAMALGLAQAGSRVLAIGHIAEDVPALAAALKERKLEERVHPLVADLRKPAECDRGLAACRERFGRVDILINNAGLTFTYIAPDRFRRPVPRMFWEVGDEIVQNVMDTNYVAADQMTRRVAPLLVKQKWGRIINVTTMLRTMTMTGSMPYGASKAALEMATHVWAKELEETGVTANILNPGAGANTPGMADEMRERARQGLAPRLCEPEEMVPPLLWLVSSSADRVNGMRFDAIDWDAKLAPDEAARRNGRPAGFLLHPKPGE
jgi:NAD(P)-dependent dehydrogenase (short-subunit alcohol dehydrogenase family)